MAKYRPLDLEGVLSDPRLPAELAKTIGECARQWSREQSLVGGLLNDIEAMKVPHKTVAEATSDDNMLEWGALGPFATYYIDNSAYEQSVMICWANLMTQTDEIRKEIGDNIFADDPEIVEAYRDAASACYGCDDIEIDTNPHVSMAQDGSGAWVSAWVWVNKGETE